MGAKGIDTARSAHDGRNWGGRGSSPVFVVGLQLFVGVVGVVQRSSGRKAGVVVVVDRFKRSGRGFGSGRE